MKLLQRVGGVCERRSTPSTRSSLLAARESFHAGRRGACAGACDTSDALIDIAHKAHKDKRYECLVADGVRLPYRSNAFDVALNIAVLHHLSTAERRLKCIQETLRILKPGGRALFYAWAKEQKNGAENRSGHQFDAPDVLVPFHLR